MEARALPNPVINYSSVSCTTSRPNRLTARTIGDRFWIQPPGNCIFDGEGEEVVSLRFIVPDEIAADVLLGRQAKRPEILSVFSQDVGKRDLIAFEELDQ